jgi:hypothetical protein
LRLADARRNVVGRRPLGAKLAPLLCFKAPGPPAVRRHKGKYMAKHIKLKKRIILIVSSILLILLNTNCFNDTNSQIPMMHKVILDYQHIDDIVQNSKQRATSWKEIESIDIKCFRYLSTFESSNVILKKQINEIMTSYSKYYIQFIGYDKNGKHYVHCNYFLNNEYLKWKTDYLFVRDGGSAFWRIEYCIDNRKFEMLSINGYA